MVSQISKEHQYNNSMVTRYFIHVPANVVWRFKDNGKVEARIMIKGDKWQKSSYEDVEDFLLDIEDTDNLREITEEEFNELAAVNPCDQ